MIPRARSGAVIGAAAAVLLVGLGFSLGGGGLALTRGADASQWVSTRGLGGPLLSLIWLGVIELGLLWVARAKDSPPALRESAAKLAWRAPVGLAAVVGVELVMKLSFPQTAHGLTGDALLGYYPSGHAARASFLLILGALILSGSLADSGGRALRALLWIVTGTLIVLVCAALTASGAHYLIDTLGGLALATAAAVWSASPLTTAAARESQRLSPQPAARARSRARAGDPRSRPL